MAAEHNIHLHLFSDLLSLLVVPAVGGSKWANLPPHFDFCTFLIRANPLSFSGGSGQ